MNNPDWNVAYIGLGSNLDNPLQQVRDAVQHIRQQAHIQIIGQSAWYRSAPLGPAGQDHYINGAIAIRTCLTPPALLDVLQDIEQQHGRQRNIRWGARTLDLDLLLFGNLTIQSERLTVPHPELARRNFVLQPLLDLNANLELPDGRKIASILAKIGLDGLEKLSDRE